MDVATDHAIKPAVGGFGCHRRFEAFDVGASLADTLFDVAGEREVGQTQTQPQSIQIPAQPHQPVIAFVADQFQQTVATDMSVKLIAVDQLVTFAARCHVHAVALQGDIAKDLFDVMAQRPIMIAGNVDNAGAAAGL